jgi:hypothetical protein
MTPEQFLERCKTLWHVGPAGSWDRISRFGFQTAAQLIEAAHLDSEEKRRLLTLPRRSAVPLRVNGQLVVIRDQEPLFRRRDLTSVLGDGMAVADWVGYLNRRVYLFTNRSAMGTLLSKYVERDGAQDVIALSPLRLLGVAHKRLELAAQNTGAIARRTGPQKHRDTFLPLARFPDQRPAEVTIVDGLDDLSPVVRAERHFKGRPPLNLAVPRS